MLSDADQQLLRRVITRNACVLFLGAGFSSDAKNSLGTPLPGGWEIGRELWKWLGYDTGSATYDQATSPLDKLFDVAKKKRGEAALVAFLRQGLQVAAYPEWYRKVAFPYWFRIYTTNVDNLMEKVYDDTRPIPLDVVNAIIHRYRDRDQTLSRLQYVKLNGWLEGGLEQLTFGARQYGARAGEYDPWYDHFVRDYATHATILVGTQLNEPLFWRALVSREPRSGAATELRLRSFLVSPDISPVLIDSLSEFNVVPVRTSAREFFEFLDTVIGAKPRYEDVIIHVNPQLAHYRELLTGDKRDAEAVKAFLTVCERVNVPDRPASYRSLFLLGASPTWQDIALALDAQREVTAEAQAAIEASLTKPNGDTIVVTGHHGSGKSTLIMRAAVNLAAAGHLVFHAFGEDVPEPHVLARAVERIDQRLVLFIDDAEWISRSLDRYLAELSKICKPPVLVLGIRANALHVLEEGSLPHSEIWIRELTDRDIDAVIDVLERENKLGVKTGQPRQTIQQAFRDRAQKQLLVAMREVTTGREFDAIMAQEYKDISDPELRVTYLCACLATKASASLSREQLLAATALPPAQLLSALNRELREVLVPFTGLENRIVARHQVIAETVVKEAPKPELATAYKRILSVLAHDMDPRARRGEARKWFRLYKRLINHLEIYHQFERNIEEARTIYDSLTRLLAQDSQFWFQYGSLELEYGELDLASSYIATAESLDPDDWFIQNAKGHLLLALGRSAGTLAEAVRLRQEGQELLTILIREHGQESEYPWHTLISHLLDWLEVWEHDPVALRRELEKLREIAADACDARPHADILRDVRKRVERAYLATAQSA